MSDLSKSQAHAGIRATGTEVHYYVLCPRKLWWFSHGMEQEHVHGTEGQENVALGQALHLDSYRRQGRREMLVDDLLRIDFTEAGDVHEVKKSRGGRKASVCQLLYYLYYLKHVKGVETTGILDFPNERRREKLALTPEREAEVERILAGVQEVREMPSPPPVPAPMPVCRRCAYMDLCWG